jgi:hypothetical protein
MISLHRLICSSSEILNDQSNMSIVVTSKVDGWSDRIYTDSSLILPSKCEFEVTLSRVTSKTGNKYWRGNHLQIIVNRDYILALLDINLSWRGKKEMISFELSRSLEESKIIEGDGYAALWLDYIDLFYLIPDVLQFVKEQLVIVCGRLFRMRFQSAAALRGLTEKESAIMSELLDETYLVDCKPCILAEEWMRQPYSPYLQGLSLKARDKMQGDLTFVGERIRYAAHQLLQKRETQGDTYISVEEVRIHFAKIGYELDVTILTASDSYQKPLKNKLKFIRDVTLIINGDMVQHQDVANAEKGLLRYWDRYKDAQKSVILRDMFPYDFNKLQLEGFTNAFKYRISCITGGPGSGKTFTSQRLCDAWRKRGFTVLVVSSYHQPLKNLKQGMLNSPDELEMPSDFKTISSCAFSSRPLFCNCTNGSTGMDQHPPSLLIVEEAGVSTMVDLYQMLQRVEKDCPLSNVTVVLLGDDEQLKPIGAGQPFKEFIKLYPSQTVRLLQNMRTDSPNIRWNISQIRIGNNQIKQGNDFIWRYDVPLLNYKNYDKLHAQFSNNFLKEFDVVHDVIIVPTNESRQLLNRILHNKHVDKLRCHNIHEIKQLQPYSIGRFIEGTRVICKKTGDGVTNGTRGIVSSLNVGNQLKVICEDRVCITPAKLWDLGYALTCHKAQGSEYTCIYIYTYNDPFVAKDWLYTAISRAKRKVVYMVPERQHWKASSVNPVQTSQSLMASIAS